MNQLLKTLCALIFAGIFLSGEAARADDRSMTSVINKAGYQRMLSQRIVKLYCQIGLGVMPEVSREQLAAAIKTYEQMLSDVRVHVADPDNQKIVEDISRQWEMFRPLASAAPARGEAEDLLVRSETLLSVSEKLTRNLQNISGDPSVGVVNLSGRQRMLSQRLAKYYMLREWGVKTAQVHDEMESAREEFANALNTLMSAHENTAEIQTELDEVGVQWNLLQAALALEGDASNRQMVADASESILNHMDHITHLYVEAAWR